MFTGEFCPLRSSLKVQLDNLFLWCQWQLWLD